MGIKDNFTQFVIARDVFAMFLYFKMGNNGGDHVLKTMTSELHVQAGREPHLQGDGWWTHATRVDD